MRKNSLIFFIVMCCIITLSHGSAQTKEKKSALGKSTFPKLTYVDLNGELGVQYELLRGFGTQVDEARRVMNAPSLAALAVMLAYAEELTGKKAKTITAIQILKEAARIVEEKQSKTGADAVILAAKKIKDGDAVAKSMREAQKLFAAKRGAGNFIAYVKIVNKTGRVLDIYVDGNYVGFLYDDESNTYSTGNGTTNTRVNDAFGNTTAEVFYLEPEEIFTWTIQP